MMRPAHVFAAIAGGRRDILVQTPSDLTRYAAMGGVILTTSCIAAISGAIAVQMALDLSAKWAIVVGVLWGAVIFNLDRLLVTQMVRQASRKAPLLLAAPRLLLAIILGVVISTPLVLQVFHREIDVKLVEIHTQRIADHTVELDRTKYRSIPVLEQKLGTAQGVVTSTSPPSVDDNPDVQKAQSRYDEAEQAFQKAEQNVVCEKEGTCGSRKRGAGIAFKEKVAIRNDAKQRRNEASSALDSVRTKVAGQLGDAEKEKRKDAGATATDTQTQLKDLRAKRAVDLADFTDKANRDNGLLSRLEALTVLSESRLTLLMAHVALFLLFFAIELLPVLVKLLHVLGPATPYEKLASKSDATAYQMHEAASDARLRAQESQLKVEEQLEQDRARRALAAGRKHNRKLARTQSEIIGKALKAWAEYALDASTEALDQWRQRMGIPARPVTTLLATPPVLQTANPTSPPAASPAAGPAVSPAPPAVIQLPSAPQPDPNGRPHPVTPGVHPVNVQPQPPAWQASNGPWQPHPQPMSSSPSRPSVQVPASWLPQAPAAGPVPLAANAGHAGTPPQGPVSTAANGHVKSETEAALPEAKPYGTDGDLGYPPPTLVLGDRRSDRMIDLSTAERLAGRHSAELYDQETDGRTLPQSHRDGIGTALAPWQEQTDSIPVVETRIEPPDGDHPGWVR